MQLFYEKNTLFVCRVRAVVAVLVVVTAAVVVVAVVTAATAAVYNPTSKVEKVPNDWVRVRFAARI